MQTGDLLLDELEKALREGLVRNAMVHFGIGSLSEAEFGTLPASGPHVRHTLAGPLELVYLGGLIVGEGSGGFDTWVDAQAGQYQTGIRCPHQSWREIGQSRMFSIQW